MKMFDKIPLWLLLLPALVLGLAPFQPQPHLLEKLTMLMQNQLLRPIDIMDLLFHGFFPVLLLLKLLRQLQLFFSQKVRTKNSR